MAKSKKKAKRKNKKAAKKAHNHNWQLLWRQDLKHCYCCVCGAQQIMIHPEDGSPSRLIQQSNSAIYE